MKLYIIAGEASGDLHGSNLIKALKNENPATEIRCWGGDLMQQAGGELVKHYKSLAFMGFTEVVLNIRTILNNLSACKQDVLNYKPDAIVLIDYPGFNLKIAEFAKKNGIKVFYYISPKVWAWNQKRALKIKKVVDKMFTIFPFETAFYKKYNFNVDYVGNPLLDAINSSGLGLLSKEDFLNQYGLNNKPIIALLPGSRKQEVRRILTEMLSIIPFYKNHYQFVIAGAPSLSKTFYNSVISTDVKIIFNDTYNILNNAHAALVTSGTATLETALFNVPQVVCYKAGKITYQIAKALIKVKYISLVNLVMDKKVVTELIQHELNQDSLTRELDLVLGPNRNAMLASYRILHEILGGGGASKKTASLLLKTLGAKD